MCGIGAGNGIGGGRKTAFWGLGDLEEKNRLKKQTKQEKK